MHLLTAAAILLFQLQSRKFEGVSFDFVLLLEEQLLVGQNVCLHLLKPLAVFLLNRFPKLTLFLLG
jgi:hypothetical protein